MKMELWRAASSAALASAVFSMALTGLAAPATVHAQTLDWPNEYAKRIKTTEAVAPLTDSVFGDRLNLFNGTVSFRITHISLPGNNALPVELSTAYDPHDVSGRRFDWEWDLDIPHVSSVLPRNVEEWLPDPGPRSNGTIEFGSEHFWNGNRLNAWGQGGDLLVVRPDPKRVVPNNSITYAYSTKDGWYFSLLPSIKNGPGKGLIGYAPDGKKYYFDWLVKRPYSSITHPWGYSIPNSVGNDIMHRRKVMLFVSRIEDRFGNWVAYEWESDHPTRIHSSDGREITMAFDEGTILQGAPNSQILSATANGRTWTFEGRPYGGSVLYPDGTRWKFLSVEEQQQHALMVANYQKDPIWPYDFIPDSQLPCSPANKLKTDTSRFVLTHPSGASAEYTFRSMRHGRTSVPYFCMTGSDEGTNQRNMYSTFHDTYSLISKRIYGPGLQEKTYTYSYEGLGQGYEQQDESQWWTGPGWNAAYAPPAPNYKIVTVTEPDGTQQVHTFGKDRELNEGQLFSVETRKAGATYRRVTNTYVSASEAESMPFPAWMGSSGDRSADKLPNSNRPLKGVSTAQDGVVFVRQVSEFDAFARPLKEYKATVGMNIDHQRTDGIGYHDDLALWVIGQPKQAYNVDTGAVASLTTYDARALPHQSFAFGKLMQTLLYHPDGSLASVADGGGNTTVLENWKRGLPQTIRYADLTSESAVVDDNGWLMSTTDEVGSSTGYQYDAAGRLRRIDYPAGDTNAWLPTTIAFDRLADGAHGLAPGIWRQSTVTGNRRKDVFLDAFLRPLLVHEFDQADAGTLRSVAMAYDDEGRIAFSSYPGIGVSAPTTGVRTAYDALGRVTRIEADSELGVLATVNEYLSPFLVRSTNPRLQRTTTAYQAFDRPSYDDPIVIDKPEGTHVDIARDVLGTPLALSQRSSDGSQILTRRYVYDQHRRLCKTVEPETGATVVDYDAADNVAWSASGVPAPATDACNRAEASASGRAASRTYDSRNRVRTLSFPDGLGDQQWEYYGDGLPKKVATRNVAGSAAAIVNLYEYNKRRLPTRERLQAAGVEWGLASAYDDAGSLATHTYPDGEAVSYQPNAMGQPTRVGAYATDVRYHPNGGMSRFVYGNGVVHTAEQNARGMVERSRDAGASAVLDDSYDYDAVGNVAAISDGLAGARGNRTMQYDGIDRLTSAASPMFGNATYSYDALDNLKSVSVAGRAHTYVYDGSNRLTNIVATATGASVVGLGYDVQGNLQNKNGQTFRFDYGNRLREAVGLESYQYDGHGRRALATASGGRILSMYDQGGVLRYQRDYRKERDTAYMQLNGSLVARVNTVIAPDLPVLSAPAYVQQNGYTVSWTAATATGSYQLEEQAGGGAWQPVFNDVGTSKAFSGKSNGSYGYRVRACNSAACSAWSAVATVVVEQAPKVAPSLSAPTTGLNGQYSLSWNSVAGATQYLVEESAGGAWATVYNGAGTQHAVSGRSAGTYSYRVKGCNPAGCGPVSATVSVLSLHPPAAAPALSAPAQSNAGSFTVSWNAVASANRYVLEQNALGAGWGTVQDASSTSRQIVGGSTGTYEYRARACNAAGCGPLSAAIAVQVIGPPVDASSLTVPASNNSGSYGIGWSGVTHATYYPLEESYEGGAWTLIQQDGSGGHTTWGRGNGRYGYRVRACNPAGCGPYSSVQFVTVILPPAVPQVNYADWLQHTRRGMVTRSTCFVRWTASPGTTRYELQSGSGVARYSGPATQVQSASSGQYCAYDYVVRACGAGGCSAWSAPPFPTTVREESLD